MGTEPSRLIGLMQLIDRIPEPPLAVRQGRPPVYPDRLFLKALVIMTARGLPSIHGLLMALAEPTPEMQALRQALTSGGRFPARRTWERRLKALPASLPARVGCLGRYLVDRIAPWTGCGRAVAIDSTVLRARGGVWHQQDRAAGVVPQRSIDTEAHWTKSGWHGWVYGWKLHVVTTVADLWIPLAAELTPANPADNQLAAVLLAELPSEARFVLGDMSYQDRDVHRVCADSNRILVATRRGAYPHRDQGVEVRRVFHRLRSLAIEAFNAHFKEVFDCRRPVPTRGLHATRRFALGAVLVYQLVLLYRFERGDDPRAGLKPFLKAA
jgi:Transposase DDE domain